MEPLTQRRPLSTPGDTARAPRPARRRRRSFLVALVLVVTAFPVVLFTAPAASAFGECGSDYRSIAIATGFIECIDPKTGAVTKTIGELESTAPALTETGSTLAAAAGEGATVSEGAGIAAADGLAAEGGAGFLLGNPIGSAVVGVALAGAGGFYAGTQIAGGLCSLGISHECYPSTPKADPITFTPNADVTGSGGDPGWSAGANVLQLHPYNSNGASPATVPVTWAVIAPSTAGTTVALGTDPYVSSEFQVSPIPSVYSGSFRSYGQLSVARQCEQGGAFDQFQGAGRVDVTDGGGLAGYFWECFDGGGSHIFRPYAIRLGAGGDSITYRFPGNSDRPPPTTPDPVRHWQTINTCSDGTIRSATSTGFHESDPTSFPDIPVPAACPAGSTLAGTRVVELTDGSSTPRPLFGPLSVPQKVQDAQTDPTCGGKKCRLDLVKIGPAGSRLGDCFTINDACADWFTDPDKTSHYKCTFGPPGTSNEIALSECNPYAPTFNPQKQAQGTPYGDPATGADPGSDPGTSPVSDPSPGVGGTSPTGECFPSGWGVFNPLNWVLQPIKCALTWAFVPQDGQLADVETGLRTDLDSSGWGEWVGALGGVFGSLQNGSGCEGPEFDFDYGPAHVHGHPLSACTGAIATAATFSRAITTVFVIIFGGLACLRALGTAFGFDVSFGRTAAPGEAVSS